MGISVVLFIRLVSFVLFFNLLERLISNLTHSNRP